PDIARLSLPLRLPSLRKRELPMKHESTSRQTAYQSIYRDKVITTGNSVVIVHMLSLILCLPLLTSARLAISQVFAPHPAPEPASAGAPQAQTTLAISTSRKARPMT